MKQVKPSMSVLVAFPKHKVNVFCERLLQDLPEVYVCPFPVLELIEIDFDVKVEVLEMTDCVIFSSAFGAEVFMKKLADKLSSDEIHQLFVKTQIATVGPSIRALLEQYKLKVTWSGAENTIASLQRTLLGEGSFKEGKRVVFVTGKKTLCDDLMKTLIQQGCDCKHWVVYDSQMLEKVDWQSFDDFYKIDSENKYICLSSPEGVKALANLMLKGKRELPLGVNLLSLGPSTYKAASEVFPNYNHITRQTNHSYSGLIESLESLSTSFKNNHS